MIAMSLVILLYLFYATSGMFKSSPNTGQKKTYPIKKLNDSQFEAHSEITLPTQHTHTIRQNTQNDEMPSFRHRYEFRPISLQLPDNFSSRMPEIDE